MFKRGDSRKAQILGLKDVKRFFKNQGYIVKKLFQPWRNVVGQISKNSKDYFLKLASNDKISEKVQNEISWNKKIWTIIKNSGFDVFNVPKIFKDGFWQGNKYYISEYVFGDLLVNKNDLRKGKNKKLKENLKKIIQINLFFLSLNEDLNLFRDRNGLEPVRERFFKNNHKRFLELKEKNINLDDLYSESIKLKNIYISSVNHGDFVPWHMILSDNKIVLIDGEHASEFRPLYYDIAYFYQRAFAQAECPQIAKKYLKIFIKKLDEKKKKEFFIYFKPVLAERIIGGFWDAMQGERNYQFHKKIVQDFTNNLLI